MIIPFAMFLDLWYLSTHSAPVNLFFVHPETKGLEVDTFGIIIVYPLAMLFLVGAFSTLIGKFWYFCMLSCVCAVALFVISLYSTAIIGAAAFVFIYRSRGEFHDLRRGKPTAPRKGHGDSG